MKKKFNNNLSIIQTTSDMHREISNAKFGICAGGFTTYEFAALKVPFAIISQVPHQLQIASIWGKEKNCVQSRYCEYQYTKKNYRCITKNPKK